MKNKVSLSQCMIVKNEEKNIRRALTWGKEFVCEQIVVDTGSEDQTVAIAESMGAKVYHFTWINDFSAAKNFAISQASGEWIAFLDADEYYDQADAAKLAALLEKLQETPSGAQVQIIRSAMLDIDSAGTVFSTSIHDRIFRNNSLLCYQNKIHEVLRYSGKKECITFDATKLLSIYHTGYALVGEDAKKKGERNIQLLNRELEDNPDDYDCWSYLGDSLFLAYRLEEARNAFERSLMGPAGSIRDTRRNDSYGNLMRLLFIDGKAEQEEQVRTLYNRFEELNCDYPDVDYWMGMWMERNGKTSEAAQCFEQALQRLETYTGSESLAITGDLCSVYKRLMQLYVKMERNQEVVRYAVLSLRINRYQDDVLGPLLSILKRDLGQKKDVSPIYIFLTKLYDFGGLKDKLYVMKIAKLANFPFLDNQIYEIMDEKEKERLNCTEQNPYRLTKEEIQVKYPAVSCLNETDRDFIALMEEIGQKSEEALALEIQECFNEMEKSQKENYDRLVAYYGEFLTWGELQPLEDNYEALDERARVLKEYREDFIWLYSRLSDYRSKKVLSAVLDNWLHFDFSMLYQVKEKGCRYFDTNLIPSGEDEVFLDIGAYTGDTVHDFIQVYGEDYKKIHCYEVVPEVTAILKNNLRKYERIEIHDKAVGLEVSIDEDRKEPVTFIKINIEGAELEALQGCACHIKKEHPKLAVGCFYTYEDICKVARFIAELDPSYEFYMRYYGENLVPTEYILFAI